MDKKFVEKRDGRILEFNSLKISRAIEKAFIAGGYENLNTEIIKDITESAVRKIMEEDKTTASVEHIQDIVIETLKECGYEDISEGYSSYRQNRTAIREKKAKLHKTIKKIIKKTGRENANVGNSPSAKLLQMAEAEGRDFMEKEFTSPDILKAMKDNLIYPHDYSWAAIGTTTCCFIPLGKLLKKGYNTGHGWTRTPKRIKVAAQLSCIIFQANQNSQHGGQAFGWYDRDMAPFVKREYNWQLNFLKENLKSLGIDISKIDYKALEDQAWENTRKETYQAMEAVVANCNTMHSRAGAQIPFTSINIGTDTTKEGRLIAEMLLKAYKAGLGKGEQPLFPNVIFKVRQGINRNLGDPNYDLYLLSMDTSCSRLFPNYSFQDSSINKDFPEDVPVMGCRTRVSWNVNSKVQTCEGRGNGSFTTVNIVGLALLSKYKETHTNDITQKFNQLVKEFKIKIPESYKYNTVIETFFVLIDKYSDLVVRQLLERLEYQCSFRKDDFPFLLDGIWMDSENLKNDEDLRKVWKHATFTMGFIGLAETLKCLVGKHHGEDEDADALGEAIVKFMREKMDKATEEHSLNFSLLATPAEGLSGKFTAVDRKKYGKIAGVTDKEWYTNSFHVPVEYKISIFKKIRIEGKYHKYCNGGQISYIELDASPADNIEAFKSILDYMIENDMSYVAINFPVDRCRNCGYQGVIEKECPCCKSTDISRIRRITGYLADLSDFGDPKKAEEAHRTKHSFA